MAYILGIDSSTDQGSIALFNNEHILFAYEFHLERAHSKLLAHSIHSLLETNNIKTDQLDAIAISAGPGSYTGLRIGAGIAKGLSYSLDIPLIEIDTLKLIAKNSEIAGKQPVVYIPMIDARRMEVYTAAYDDNFKLINEIHPKILEEDSFIEFSNKTVVLSGNGATKSLPIFKERDHIYIPNVFPHAKNMGAFAYKKYQENNFVDQYWEPFYLKEFKPGKPKPL